MLEGVRILTGNSAAMAALAGQRILVLEDEYFLAQHISQALIQAGAAVVGPFPTLADAFAGLQAGQALDAALLDVNLRGEMVFPVAEALRRQGVAFLFMTGYDKTALPPAYRDVPVCEKPVSIHDIALQLATLSGREIG